MEWYDIVNLVAVFLIGLGNMINTFLSTAKSKDVKVAAKLKKLQDKEAKLVQIYNDISKVNN